MYEDGMKILTESTLLEENDVMENEIVLESELVVVDNNRIWWFWRENKYSSKIFHFIVYNDEDWMNNWTLMMIDW